jgi:hypothetical protein
MRDWSITQNTIVVAFAAAALLAVLLVAASPQQAKATPQLAKNQPCTKCHIAPPVLNDYGKKFKEEMKK